MKNWLSRLLRAVGLNAVPLGGLTLGGWSSATVLALYWLETVMALPVVALLIAVHRRRTRANGHYRAHFAAGAEEGDKPGSLLGEVLLYGGVFCLAHGLFLTLFLGFLLPRLDPALEVNFSQLRNGLLVVLVILAIAFARDLVGIGERRFEWIKEEARGLLGRAVLVHLAIIGGVWLGAVTDKPVFLLLVFGSLKLLADVARLWPRRPASDEAPGLLTWLLDRIPGTKSHPDGFAGYYREQHNRARALVERDEQPRG